MIQLHEGDCLDIMPTIPIGSVDMIFADPPFNAGKAYLGDLNDAKPVAEYYTWLGARLAEMVRLLKFGGCLWLMQDQRHVGWCQVELQRLGLDFHNIVVWAYANPTPVKGGLPKTWRPILLMSKGPPAFFDNRADALDKETLYHNPTRRTAHWPHDIWPDIPKLVGGFLAQKELLLDAQGRFAHLAQMPVRIAERAIRLATRPGEVVLDPFCGSGTVAVACQTLGRSCIAIEQSAAYVALARQRLADAQLQPVLLTE